VQVSITFKNQQVLKDCTWEVKKGERVGLVGEWGHAATSSSGSSSSGRSSSSKRSSSSSGGNGSSRVWHRAAVAAVSGAAVRWASACKRVLVESERQAADVDDFCVLCWCLPTVHCCHLRVPPGVNGAGKTTQLQIVMGRLTPDSGEVIKAKRNMKVAYLAQVM
jgi:ABC-type polar amino acid transport system ATPase subunit